MRLKLDPVLLSMLIGVSYVLVNGGNHVQLVIDGRRVLVLPRTPSSKYRQERNARAALRRFLAGRSPSVPAAPGRPQEEPAPGPPPTPASRPK